MEDFKQTKTLGDTGDKAVLSQDEKNWGMFCHVAVFAGCICRSAISSGRWSSG